MPLQYAPMTTPRAVLEQATTIAVVGMSNNESKAAFAIPAGLQSAGFTVIPVNPNADEILGEKAYPRLADVPAAVDIVNVFRPSAEAPDIAREAVAIGAKALWLQKGLGSAEAREIAEAGGLAYLEDLCIGVARARYGIVKDNG